MVVGCKQVVIHTNFEIRSPMGVPSKLRLQQGTTKQYAWSAKRESDPPQNRGPAEQDWVDFHPFGMPVPKSLLLNGETSPSRLQSCSCGACPLQPSSLGEILPRCSAAARSSCRASRGAFLRCVDVPIQAQKALIVTRCAHSLLLMALTGVWCSSPQERACRSSAAQRTIGECLSAIRRPFGSARLLLWR